MIHIVTGFILAFAIAVSSYRLHALSASGAFGATVMGTIVFAAGGLPASFMILTFFITSSALSSAFKQKKRVTDQSFAKGGPRDAWQVIANGAIATVFVLLGYFLPRASWPWLGFSASLAAVTADTWATELGTLDPRAPRLITDLRRVVDKGTSGGLSITGTLASAAGAAVIGFLALFLGPQPAAASTGLIIAGAGFLGAMFDSLLGATVQAMYLCPKDDHETEQHPLHWCGTPTTYLRGWRWITNDVVNLSCAAFAALLALGIYLI